MRRKDNSHCKSSKKRINGCALHAIAPTSLQNMYLSRRLGPIPFTVVLGIRSVSTLLSSDIHFCKLGMSSNKLLPPDPIASWIRHFIERWVLPTILLWRMLPKKEFKAEARTVSGRADLSNFPPMMNPFNSFRGFLI